MAGFTKRIAAGLGKIRRFAADTGAASGTKDVIKLAIAAIIAGAILPTAVSEVSTVNTTGWNSSAQALWPLVPIFLVLGVALVFIKIVLDKL
jgi:flagellar biosynthesis protein FlhB